MSELHDGDVIGSKCTTAIGEKNPFTHFWIRSYTGYVTYYKMSEIKTTTIGSDRSAKTNAKTEMSLPEQNDDN